MSGAYYFGCWSSTGHGIHLPGGESVPPAERMRNGWYPDEVPWDHIDGKLTPGQPSNPHAGATGKQGDAALHHKDGWTALAIHDFTVDSRGNSNSVFLFHSTLTFGQAVMEAEEQFPKIVKRIGRIKLVEDAT